MELIARRIRSFSPSMNIRTNPPDHPHYQRDAASSVCHYVLQAGVSDYWMPFVTGLLFVPPLLFFVVGCRLRAAVPSCSASSHQRMDGP